MSIYRVRPDSVCVRKNHGFTNACLAQFFLHFQVITPYVREIYVITQIKIKITEHCERLAKGEESTFGQ